MRKFVYFSVLILALCGCAQKEDFQEQSSIKHCLAYYKDDFLSCSVKEFIKKYVECIIKGDYKGFLNDSIISNFDNDARKAYVKRRFEQMSSELNLIIKENGGLKNIKVVYEYKATSQYDFNAFAVLYFNNGKDKSFNFKVLIDEKDKYKIVHLKD